MIDPPFDARQSNHLNLGQRRRCCASTASCEHANESGDEKAPWLPSHARFERVHDSPPTCAHAI
jgi:hypothetical protein